jgi:ParB/RepB/Spo0J family partition protein
MIVTDIPLDLLTPHPHNVRRDIGDVTELAASITGVGLLQPLTVAPVGEDQYVVIAGHRRLAAAKKAGLTTVPCLVRHDLVNRVDQLEAMLTENLQRTDLTVMEEAAAYEQLTLLGVKPAEIAKATGRSRATVDSRMKLLALPEKARTQVDTGQLTLNDAEFLLKHVDDPGLMKAAEGKTGQNLRYAIESELRDRRWAAEREQRKAQEATQGTPTKTRETAAQKEARLQREAEQAEREARRRAIEASHAVQRGWILERIAAGDAQLADQLTRVTVEQLAQSDSDAEWFTALGVEPCGEDDDVDDHRSRTIAKVNAWPIDKARLLLALCCGDHLEEFRSWSQHDTITRLELLVAHAGYQPSDAERALLDDGGAA